MTQDKAQWEEQSLEEVIKEFNSDPEQGLSEKSVKQRLDQYGHNRIEEEEQSFWLDLLSHFWGPIPWMLEIAVILSAIAQRWEDFTVIFVMLLINGGVSFWHEHKAENAVEALKQRLSPKATVIRNGEEQQIDSANLVPGDIVHLKMGNIVPADAKIIKTNALAIDESALTGESLPVEKEKEDSVYSGTSIKRGEGTAIITATAENTKFARTVELVEAAEEKSHFQKAVLKIGYWLIGLTAVLVLTIVGVEIMRGQSATEVLLFALVLTIAGIPQALPAVLTVTMTIGAKRLARHKAIVSKLTAMEEMAGLQILCADKTGTLTKNELELQDPELFACEDKKELVLLSALTTKRDGEDPIDNAILDALENKDELNQYKIEAFRPFDPTRKRAEADVRKNGSSFTVAKGAPQVILDLLEPDNDVKDRIFSKVNQLGESGFRALGVAKKEAEGNWEFLGILPLLDPPRDESAEVLNDAKKHNIDVRMVTGDHAAIAKQVAGQIGLGQNIPEATELFKEGSESEEYQVKEDVLKADGYAQVTPEHKFHIIKSLQANNRIVAMTGDGVNDAPALKQSDVGIAVASATDAARAASDLVLTVPGLGVIIHAIEEARRIFERMTSYSIFRITETMRVLLFISISILVFQFYPVTPIMVVLLAILNDIPIMTIATDNAPAADHPVRWNMKRVLTLATVLSVVGVAMSFLLFWYVNTQTDLSNEKIQTIMFLKLLVSGHFTIYITRHRNAFWRKPWPSWQLFTALEATQIIGTLFSIFGWLITPISIWYVLMVWAFSIVTFLLNDAAKILTYKVMKF